jgi:uncharacterized membrane protein YgcG
MKLLHSAIGASLVLVAIGCDGNGLASIGRNPDAGRGPVGSGLPSYTVTSPIFERTTHVMQGHRRQFPIRIAYSNGHDAAIDIGIQESPGQVRDPGLTFDVEPGEITSELEVLGHFEASEDATLGFHSLRLNYASTHFHSYETLVVVVIDPFTVHCATDNGCLRGMSCIGSICQGSSCWEDAHCPSEQRCIQDQCRPIPAEGADAAVTGGSGGEGGNAGGGGAGGNAGSGGDGGSGGAGGHGGGPCQSDPGYLPGGSALHRRRLPD